AVQVAVSISPLLAGDGRLVDLIAEALDTTGLPPKRLRIEITESMVLRDRERALQRLHAVRRLGVTIGLENVGAGPCSLDVLRSFPFDQIRLHPTILESEPASTTGPFMLSVIMTAARRLDIPVIAEGVNALSSYHLARRSGCDSMQGSLEGLPHLLMVPNDSKT
ncbi:MAG: EAL domain-containing protein, partial [Terriglobus roseus]|nr:EAL domain-containing protein [Terriglobus roseus]